MTATEGSGGLSEIDYRALVTRVQSVIARTVPPGSSVLVVSKGDDTLLDIPGMRAAHFPQSADGRYAGHHPADSAAATQQLEALRRTGADYLAIPSTALWWLDHYDGFAHHLASHGELVGNEPNACLVYALGPLQGAGLAAEPLAKRSDQSAASLRDFLENLLPTDAAVLLLDTDTSLVIQLFGSVDRRFPPDGPMVGGDDRLTDELRSAARGGADYLVIPRSTEDWLKDHHDFADFIERHCHKIAHQRYLCRVFDLTGLRSP